MIYFDVRPSAHLATLELRICDSCPALADVVLLAGLFRPLVIREIEAEHEGLPPVSVRPGLLEAATWRAAQAGLQGDLVDPVTAGPVPADRLTRRGISQLLAGSRPALGSTGDWERVSELARSAMARGSSAARQRAARGSGGLRRVVDTLIAETHAVPPWLPGRHAGRVTAGRVLRASGEAHPDLFWALRGGGYFGVVTSFCYRLHPVTGAFGGMLGNSLDRADAPSPHSVIILKRMGGAAGRVPADATPFWYRDAVHSLEFHAQWAPDDAPGPHIA